VIQILDVWELSAEWAHWNILAPDAAERFRDALPQGRLVTVPNCGHNVHGQNTLGFIAALGEFLQSLD
jgi:pimeloyl-ACP methyl ester carboxylesterase